MKVILTKDVPTLGQAGAIKKVADGYGRNYLLPRGLAVLATPALVRVYEAKAAQWTKKHEQMLAEAKGTVAKLKGIQVVITGPAQKGTLFGSVGQNEIAAALAGQGFELPASVVALSKPLKALGEHSVTIRFGKDVEAVISVVLRAGDEAKLAQPKAKIKAKAVVKSKSATKKKAKAVNE